MLILGATSDTAKAYVEYCLKLGERFENICLVSNERDELGKLSNHYEAKYDQKCIPVACDLTQDEDFSFLDNLSFSTVFCATGFLGKPAPEAYFQIEDAKRIIQINYSRLVLLLNAVAYKLERNGEGTMIILSSVAGDRGRQSNFIYGSAKAAVTAYASGLRNYLSKKGVHVMTVKPGFMNTSMTAHLDLPAPLTAQPDKVAKIIHRAARKKKDEIYVLWMWKYIMLIIRNIPEFVFKKLSM